MGREGAEKGAEGGGLQERSGRSHRTAGGEGERGEGGVICVKSLQNREHVSSVKVLPS